VTTPRLERIERMESVLTLPRRGARVVGTLRTWVRLAVGDAGRLAFVRGRVRVLAVLTALTVAAACSSSPPLLRGAIKVDKRANPDANGRPSPVVVRVYELKTLTAFNNADFFALFEKETEALGGDLVGREEFQLDPGETRPYQRQLQPDTKFIGVAAAFRDLEHARWRQAAPVPAKRTVNITLGLEVGAVTVALK
jgi:type VI secretion system protein VasD